MSANKTLDQLYTANPLTTIEDTDIFYSVRAAADGAISGASLKAAFMITGEVRAYAGSSAPDGWMLAYGQAISRTTYAALFAVCGTTYGSGNGTTTFNVPDLRGRVIAGKDDMGGSPANRLTTIGGLSANDTIGATGGNETIPMTIGNAYGAGSEGQPVTAIDGSTSSAKIIQPTIVLNYIIKT